MSALMECTTGLDEGYPCGLPAVAMQTFVCVHEHVVDRPKCGFHAGVIHICSECTGVGAASHYCDLKVMDTRPLVSS